MEEEDTKIPRIKEEDGNDIEGLVVSKEKMKTRKKKYWIGCLRAKSDENGNVDLTVDFPGERSEPTHLVVMVNGLIGSAENWRFAAKQMLKKYPQELVVHCSKRNSSTQTFDGVDIMGERLAEEVRLVIKRHPSLQKISFVGHSLGGLIARYAIGRLYEKESREELRQNSDDIEDKYPIEEPKERIAGLEPVYFITSATPHLGTRGHKQVPLFSGSHALERLAIRMSWLLGKTGKHLFLADGDEGKPPLLLRMVTDRRNVKFISALKCFNDVCKKLDRVLINDVWLSRFPDSYCVYEPGGVSDHMRCRFQKGEVNQSHKKPFKFLNVLAEHPEFLNNLRSYWTETEELFQSTSTIFRFSKKLKNLKKVLNTMGRTNMGNIVQKTKEALEDLCQKQSATLLGPSEDNMRSESDAYSRWQNLAVAEENYLKQKSKVHWLKVGDKNNRFFHNAIKTRQARNAMKEILCRDGRVVTSKKDIKEEAEGFFKDFLNQTPDDYSVCSVSDLEDLLEFKCSDHDIAGLTKEVTDAEIHKVLFSMPSNKAPGPDGYTSEFFKAGWDVIGSDFLLAVKAFFAYGFLPKGVNSTILTLVPKKDQAREIKDYRPISCCNVFYKVISKILANRLKVLLPVFISSNQSAFIKDRLLVENVLLASELVKDYHKNSIAQSCALKIDISKAFDSVNWEFLLNVLQALGFPHKFVHWIKLCITTASFSVQVNGELAGYFQSKRGLRQGCALSPYLFVICMNTLSRMLNKAARNKEFGFHPWCQNLCLTHLSFADDIMIFSDGSRKSIEGIVGVFDRFATISGLRISMEKSTLYLAGVSDAQRAEITSHFPFSVGSFPVRYLGLPLMTKQMKPGDYLPLVERIRNKMQSWHTRFLSFAGRLQLIQSVIVSTINFWLAAFRLPSKCIQTLESLCSAFLWAGPSLNTRKAKLAWPEVCKLKTEGGLGVRSLKEVNKVMCLKLIWRVLSATNSLWVDWIKVYLIRKGSLWSLTTREIHGSWIWKKLLKYRDLARDFHRVDVGNGESTFFWFDVWTDMGYFWNLVGIRGVIDMGVGKDVRLSEIPERRRRRNHRISILNAMEEELEKFRLSRGSQADRHMWRNKAGTYRARFSSKDTWSQIRRQYPTLEWVKGIWFRNATPKFAFVAWLALRNRLATGDRISQWNRGYDPTCILCGNAVESVPHLFFACEYSTAVWGSLVEGLMRTSYTKQWPSLISIISHNQYDYITTSLVRYVFQVAIHQVWRERNRRKHGEPLIAATQLVTIIDQIVRCWLRSVRRSDKKMEEALICWFASRRTNT